MIEYNRNNPFLAKIKERYSLCQPGTNKNTQHIVLDLSGSGITYDVGDSIAIFPENDPTLVEKTLRAMNANGSETIIDKKSGESFKLKEFLLKKGNIKEFSKKFLLELIERQTNEKKKKVLENFKEVQESRELWDILAENEEVTFSPQELCNLMMPLMARFYSIASSMKAVGEEVHLTVALLQYETNNIQRLGVCTHFLCNLAPLNQSTIPVYIQPHKGFTLPEPHRPVIMIGPGTGVAPFRGFMQERILQENHGSNWLFFGEWNRSHHYFYGDYWNELASKNKLRIDLAFSRDQQHKVYVQDKMKESGEELYNWIKEGAILYVCGNASAMAKDVDAALHHIVEKHGKLDPQESQAFIKNLRAEKRYLRDVY